MTEALLSKALRRFCSGFSILLVCLSIGTTATAEDVAARGSVRGEGLVNTDQGVTVVDGRVDFEIDISSFTFGGAYRAYDFGGDYNPARIDPVYDIKHRFVEVRRKALFAKGGHYFSTFGRGLTLRSFEDVELEHDTALDGFIAEYDGGGFMVTALTGKHREELPGVPYRDHRVRGGRLQASLSDMITIAASGLDRNTLRYDNEEPSAGDPSRFDDEILGAELEMWAGPLVFAGEFARREGVYYRSGERTGADGHGTYLTASVTTGRLTLLGEYKDYERFAHELTSPPICVKEHVWTLMNRVTHQVDFNGERGFLVEGTLSAPGDISLVGGASEARTQGGGLEHWEIFGQVDQIELRWGIRSLAGSWSREYPEAGFTEHISLGLDLEYQVGSGQVVEIGLEGQATERFVRKDLPRPTHEDVLVTLTFYPWPGVTLAALGEATSSDIEARDFWISGEIRMEVAQDFEVALGGGTERGGKKCSGGICYTAPEFSGVRLRFSTYF
jgi:hypothetical protein